MRFLKWWIRLRLTSVYIPLFVLLLSALACHRREKPSHAGIPLAVKPGSFKVSMKFHEEEGSAAKQAELLKVYAEQVAQAMGCHVAAVEAMAWENSAVSQRLASRYHVTFVDCALDREQVDEVATLFEEKEQVANVEADALMMMASDNDPLRGQEYYLDRVSRDAACEALDKSKLKEVIVAVLDSGVDSAHPDLKANLLRDREGRVVGANFVNKGARGAADQDFADYNGHGTHVAGLIAATGNNGEGGVGVASCASIKIMPVRVLDEKGSGNSLEIERGIQWALAHGADIINISLGTVVAFPERQDHHHHPLYDEAAARGVIIFAAAGNDGQSLGVAETRGGFSVYFYNYPASYDSVIAVGATTQQGNLAAFSNRGQSIDIAVPGAALLSTLPGGRYGLMSGTSMATPVAAGLYALVLSATRVNDTERLPIEKLGPLLKRACAQQNIDARDIESGGVLDGKILLTLVRELGDGEAETPIQTEKDRPAPLDRQAETKAPEPQRSEPPLTGMRFLGLTDGQSLRGPIRIALKGWPEGKTVRIYVGWIPRPMYNNVAFTSLNASHLAPDHAQVVSADAYYLFGEGVLVATAFDAKGQALQSAQISLKGF